MGEPLPTRQRRMRPHELARAVEMYKELSLRKFGMLEACEYIGHELGFAPSTIQRNLLRLAPTSGIAETFLRSQALRLAERVVRKANVEQAIDILTRKNIGVLAPKSEEKGGMDGFFLSVQADSCGAVKVGVAQGFRPQDMVQPEDQTTELAPPKTTVFLNGADDVIRNPYEEPGVPHPGQGSFTGRGISRSQQSAIEKARERIEAARRKERSARHFGVQNADGQSESAGRDEQAGEHASE